MRYMWRDYSRGAASMPYLRKNGRFKMKTTIELDFVCNPSAEAKICLNCNKKKCTPNCSTLKRKLKELKRKEKEK